MRIVATSDWHADWVTHGVRRHAEVEHAAQVVAGNALDNDKGELKADLFVFLGDLADPEDVPSVVRAIRLSLGIATTLRWAGVSSFWLPGNHDVFEDGSGGSVLLPLGEVDRNGIHLLAQPGITFHGWGYVLALPYSPSSHPYDPERVVSEAVERIVKVDPRTSFFPTIVLSHLSVPGVQPGEETKEMPRGREVIFPFEAVAKIPGRKLVLQGHYHRQQTFRSPQGYDIHIPGSLARLTFGEEKYEPGFLSIEV